jgi:exosortase
MATAPSTLLQRLRAPADARIAWGVAGLWLLVCAVILPYQHWDFAQRSSIFGGILRKAQQDSEWWFCLTAPPLCAWMIHRARRQWSTLPLQGHWSGAVLTAAAMACFWFGYRADTAYAGYAALQLLGAGLLLGIGGLAWWRVLVFPWIFLIFTWPMLPLENLLAVPLRLHTAGMAAGLLNLIGYPAVHEGTGLMSAADAVAGVAAGSRFQLDVDQPCAGMRSLFSLLMIAALQGWLGLRQFGPRLLLMLCAVPLAVFGNLLRLLLLAIGATHLGSEVAIGRRVGEHQEMSFLHSMAGLLVYAVALAGILLLSRWLASREKRVTAQGVRLKLRGDTSGLQLLLLSSLIALTIALTQLGPSSFAIGPLGVKAPMPLQVGAYVATANPASAREKSLLDEDVRIERQFYSKPGRSILATLVMGGAQKRSLHSPEVCLPAQGWQLSGQSNLILTGPDASPIRATLRRMNRLVQGPGGSPVMLRALFIYWFVGSDGSTCATDLENSWRTYADAVLKGINHRWSMLTFFIPLEPGASEDPYAEVAALEESRSFIEELLPQIQSMRSSAAASTR